MNRRIHGEGPSPCHFMFVGEGPGWQEDKEGRPFIGKTGEELNRFLDGGKLPLRKQVFLTNIYREFKGKDYIYTSDDLTRGEVDLKRELARVQPKLIITLGRHATRYFLGDVDMDGCEGLAWVDPNNSNRTIFPIIHPAAGFHNPEMSPYVVRGFSELARFLTGEVEARYLFNDPYPEQTYEELKDVKRLRQVLSRTLASGPVCRPEQALFRNLAIDTEGSPAKPWSLQFSMQPGTAYLIRAHRGDLLAAFGDYLVRVRPHLTYHSALHDIGMMRVLGLPIDLPFDDTMVMAYLQQLEPQGLKALCARHCGMKMHSYDEVLGDAVQRLALDYISGLWDCEQLDWESAREDAFWAEIDKGRRLKVFPKLPKTPLHKAAERMLRSKDARKLWWNQVEDIRVAGYRRLGPLPEATLSHVPEATAVHYGCRDADGTVRVQDALEPRLDSLGLRDVYQLELGTYPLIERMSHIGLKPDLEHFANLSLRLEHELVGLQSCLGVQTGNRGFNANSGDQVADYLFDQLGLDGGKRTTSGRFSTNKKILEGLEHEFPEYPVITTILDYREYYKLKHTFVDRLADFVRRFPFDGRIHATFRTTRVITGRLAASDPNLLAMPKHGKFAKDFRRGWVAEAGHILAEWDLSQIELRVLAHLSQDPVFLSAFRTGVDLHAVLAQRMYGGKIADYQKGTFSSIGELGRLAAKAVNFGIPMGMTCKGLSVELRKNGVHADEDDAQKWLDETMALYKGVPVYQDRMAAEARRNGYVRCLSGRIRYVGGIRSRDERVRAEAERFAFSTPIQEGAQWLMKQAEQKLYEDILVPYWRHKRWVEPLIQIHDALTLELEHDMKLARELNAKMIAIMTHVPKGFSVPIETSGDYGLNWQEMEAF